MYRAEGSIWRSEGRLWRAGDLDTGKKRADRWMGEKEEDMMCANGSQQMKETGLRAGEEKARG